MKKIILIIFIMNNFLYADDNLKNFLIDNGIIDKNQYENYIKDKNKPNAIEIKSLLTLRYYYLDNKNYSISRERFFLQLKTEFFKKINDEFTLIFGFATGDKNKPRSNFELMSDGFSNKNLNLNLANIVFKKGDIKLVGGKFKNNLWHSNSAIIDSDINFDGFGFEYNKNNFSFIFNNLFLWEFSQSKKDPLLHIFHLSKSNKYFKIAATYYDFVYIKGISTTTFSSRPSYLYPSSNTQFNSKYKYDYDIISYDLKIDFKVRQVGYSGFINYGENLAVSKNNDFIVYGGEIYLIKNNFKKIGLSYNYRKLKQDSFLDIFPDIASYGGSTGSKSERMVLCYNLNKDISFLAYYIKSKALDYNYKSENSIIVDFNFKF